MNSILKKAITAITGLLMVGFAFFHLLGNITLLSPDPQVFNLYVQKLHSFGWLVVLGEIGLLVLFGTHVVNGIALKINHRAARPERYKKWRSKGGNTHAGPASLSMAITGLVLLVFLIIHLWKFRFGPSINEGYVTTLGGEPTRDLQRLVAETYANPWWVVFYVIVMLILAVHLRHGFWSAFQSLGVSRPRVHRVLQPLAWLIAILLAVGFIALPVVMYLRSGGSV